MITIINVVKVRKLLKSLVESVMKTYPSAPTPPYSIIKTSSFAPIIITMATTGLVTEENKCHFGDICWNDWCCHSSWEDSPFHTLGESLQRSNGAETLLSVEPTKASMILILIVRYTKNLTESWFRRSCDTLQQQASFFLGLVFQLRAGCGTTAQP